MHTDFFRNSGEKNDKEKMTCEEFKTFNFSIRRLFSRDMSVLSEGIQPANLVFYFRVTVMLVWMALMHSTQNTAKPEIDFDWQVQNIVSHLAKIDFCLFTVSQSVF